MNGFNPDELIEQYMSLQSGEPRMRAIRAAIVEAERAQDDAAAMQFHHDLIHESVFSGDRYQALIDFPQFLAIQHRNPELEAEWTHDRLWMFKWIVEAATEFYQIEKKQILQWFSEFRRDLLKNGYSLRSWYEKRAIFYQYADRAKMRMDYAAFLEAPKDSMSDGEASEPKNELSVQEQTVLDIIRNNEGLSKAEIAGRIGKSERSTQRIISNLIKKDLVVPQGANQSRTWKIKE